jgi:hypothetical protein
VVVSGEGADKRPFYEETYTVVVNAHGALILLEAIVRVGQSLTLRNAKSQEEVLCRVVDLNSSRTGQAEVGVEFLQPSPRFWHIAFPPVDWSPRSEEAKRHTPRSNGGNAQ